MKYIHKYIYKGSDRATFRLTSDGDEVSQYLQGRYIGPPEALWRLFEFPVHEEFPPVIQLAVHLPGEQPVYFQPDQSAEEIRQRLELSRSTLTAFFQYNAEHEDGRNCLYQDFPSRYVFDKKHREWRRRRNRGSAIGRMYYCSPVAGERFYLRLLLTSVPGPTSLEDIRTAAGTVYPTFQAACVALGLLEDDREWIDCLTEASVFASGAQLRSLFVTALVYGMVAEPAALWDRFKQAICDDLPHVLARQDDAPADGEDVHLDYGLYLIDKMLTDQLKTLADYGLPRFQHQWSVAEGNPLLAAELRYDHTEEGRLFTELRQQLNADQAACFNAVVTAVDTDPRTAHFFLQGPAGTGKTFLYRCLCYYFRSLGGVVLCVASSGIAALLLPGGRTAHSRFRIPLEPHEESSCNVPKNSHLAELLRRTSLIIWDEVPMQHRYCFEAVHRMLTDVRSDHSSTFGGVPAVFGGDFAQILPVVRRGSRAAIVDACLQRSFLWPAFRILSLRINMRVRHGERNQRFAIWVRSLSSDASLAGTVSLPPGIAQFRSEDPFYGYVYPPHLLAHAHLNPETFRDRAILTVRNDTVAEINEAILTRLHGSATTFHSTDAVERSGGEDDSIEPPPPELLQTFNPSSLPPSKLSLKVGAPVILLRNLYPSEGLCNGTRMVVTHIGRRCIETRILGGSFHNQLRLIPRIKLTSTEGELPYIVSRRQFPVRLCFAMTVNKSQGQSFNSVGVDLRTPVFTHGQLYVALSRVTNIDGLSLLLPQDSRGVTDNIIYPKVLLHG